MALAPPRLDDRSYNDLRAELIRRIPVHAPEWTDHNDTDPGIALLIDHLGTPASLSACLPVSMPALKGGASPPATSTAATVDGSLWLCLLAPNAVMKALDTGNRATTLERVRQTLSGHGNNIGIRTDDALCGSTDALCCPDPDTDPGHWPVRYDISICQFSGPAKRIDKIVYQRLAVSGDTTNGIGQFGTVRLRLPDRNGNSSTRFGGWTADSFDPPASWLGSGFRWYCGHGTGRCAPRISRRS